jgi:hypothetical protein
MDNIEAENSQGLLAGAVQAWLVNPELYTVTVTVPAPGEQEVHDAALAASLFHFGELTVPQVKEYLRRKHIPVR